MMRLLLSTLAIGCLALPARTAAAQEAATIKPPDTVFLEDLTWDELKQLIQAGKTTVILATAGTEQKGPHMVIGEHKYALEYTTDKIARALGNTIVAPIITYVPEGSWDPPSGHMTKAGSITLPDDRFEALVEITARSLKGGGFKDIILIGDSGGNQSGMSNVATKLNTEWKGAGVRLHFIPDYYTKAQADQRRYLTEKLNIPAASIGSHAGILDTSELMFINAKLLRPDKFVVGTPALGHSGDPTKATKEIGKALLQIKIDNAVAQIKTSMAAPPGSPSPEK